MSEQPRYLIITADERTWKFDRPVIFLGRWCLLHERRHIWSKMDAIIASPYGLGQEQKDRDHEYVRNMEEKLILILRDELNRINGTNYNVRYWKIVLGHWLSRYTDVLFNRYHTLSQCLEKYTVSGITVLSNDQYHLATPDSLSFIWACNDEIWNNILYRRILEFLDEKDLSIEYYPLEDVTGFRTPVGNLSRSAGRRMLFYAYRKAESITDLFVRNHDGLIIDPYLPRLLEVKLQLSLGQVPKLRQLPKPVLPDPDPGLRNDLTRQILKGDEYGFPGFIRTLLFELLPTCYLEGYEKIRRRVKKLHLPERPNFIFTSNNFDTDELFKCWTAEKTEGGTPYIVGQHGNNYGTYRQDNPTIEESTSDKFLTWGWSDGLKQHTPAFIYTTAGLRSRTFDPNGILLLIEICLPHRITTWDIYPEYEDYFTEQQMFVQSLDQSPRDQLTIRLHQEYKKHRWSEEKRWHEFDPKLQLDDGSRCIRKLIAKSRLVVHSYDSTGILETLSQNIPTLAFWQYGLSHLRESAKPFYQLLLDAGIVHTSPRSVAFKVNEVWENVPGWWNSDEIQTARIKFCDRYARTSMHPVRDLKMIITKNIK